MTVDPSLPASAPAGPAPADLLAQAEELARIGSMQVEWATGQVSLSAGMCRLFGESPGTEPVPPDWLFQRVPPEEREFVRTLSQGATDSEPFEFAHRIVRSDGSRRTVLHRAQAEVDATGHTVRMCTILQDISAQRESEQALQDLANLDAVTRLPNRRAFLNLLQEHLQQAAGQDGAAVLLLMEVDPFRLVNDSLGYAAGDQLLREVAARLAACPATPDTLAHLGGAHFAAVMLRHDGSAEVSAQRLADDWVHALAAPLVVAGSEVFLSGSLGVAISPTDGDEAALLLDRAQTAMRQGQGQGAGHNETHFYTAAASERATRRLAFETALRHAVERGELRLDYLPQVDLRTGRITGVEARLRWISAERGEVPFDEFMPVAEQIGQAVAIGEWALNQACTDAMAWQTAGLASLRVSAALRRQHIELPDLAQRIERALARSGLPAERLGVQVSEAMLLQDPTRLGHSLAALKAVGVQLTLAEFGTGSSNLGTLNRLPIDEVRIDRSLVPDLVAASEDVSITRALIDLAHRLRMNVLADGVDSEGQLALLVASHCDRVQGRCLSGPVPAAQLVALLQADTQLPQPLLSRHSRPRTLLLVDDEDNILSALRRLLRRDGYHILTATGGAEGLRKLAENTVDVIISDQRMPHMTGVEFLRRAKELYPDSVRLCLSGYTELQSITDAVNEGAVYRFLTKPWDDEQLRSHVAEAFMQRERAERTRALDEQLRAANRDLALANERLQSFSDRLSRQINRHDTHLAHAQDMLDGLPLPLIGVDCDGVIAYSNDAAQRLLPQAAGLGRAADDVLPAPLRGRWRQPPREPIDIDGRRHRVLCNPLGTAHDPRGCLLILSPLGDGVHAQA